MKLRIKHYPQIPCKPFIEDIESLKEAKKIYDVLALYDLFQYENKIKPDYTNMTLLEYYDEKEKEWLSWYDDETGECDLRDYYDFLKKYNIEKFNEIFG